MWCHRWLTWPQGHRLNLRVDHCLRGAKRHLGTLNHIQECRINQWELEKARQQLVKEQQMHDKIPIEVTFMDSNSKAFYPLEAIAGETTPIDLLRQIQEKNLPKPSQALVARLDAKKVIDLRQPINSSCELDFLDFSSEEGKKVFWHSSAHVLGQALEAKYQEKIRLCDGPALKEGGFFYEMFLHDQLTVSESDFQEIHDYIKKIIKQKQPFERMEVSRDFAKQMFAYSPYKLDMLQKISCDDQVSLYRCGPLIDLCRGPHVTHTGVLTAFQITRCGASNWDASTGSSTLEGDLLQRVYGISFPNKALLKEWTHLQEEAKKRDHRLLGKAQQLFLFHPLSPGSSFFLPHGTRVFNKLANFIRDEYRKRGYEEVITPLIYKKELWETSGHLQNYKEDMFMVSQGIVDKGCSHGHKHTHGLDESYEDTFGLKPMNCPGHCLIFREAKKYSYRELPVRLADFSALHRNEASGALTGLTRVRRFHQDDAHIFCTPDQVQSEIKDCLEFINHVYGVFGFSFDLRLSTRPEKYMGELSLWENAEAQLTKALEEFGQPWQVNEGDGAFYGPKIDVVVTDALKRQHQCGTIQLDFQLPLKFDLKYDGPDGQEHTPIIVHRAVLGSIERMMAILMEHTAGKWPLWLSPRQIAVLPISENQQEYAKKVTQKLHDAGLYVDIQDSNKTLNKRIREAQLSGYKYILVLGDKEKQHGQVNVRTQDNQVHGAKDVDVFLEEIQQTIQRLE